MKTFCYQNNLPAKIRIYYFLDIFGAHIEIFSILGYNFNKRNFNMKKDFETREILKREILKREILKQSGF